ncbi:pilus assembly protein CpaE [Maritalea mobilis]|uniref:Pilus assembly protein CpaE n=1 Tax=Maritalea mobilis TaxID=483324 RepID=A0A4R6VKU6_9HYPH|nr:AAA family ATPase [Maritalea mobilis]TDQ64289.1 pilus assembly protein CpaE [Maritalea mobilis]
MSDDIRQNVNATSDIPSGARLVPHITIQAFCENAITAQSVESAINDRRMHKVALTTHNGGIEAAVETYKINPTPNLIIIESNLAGNDLLSALDRLAEVCDASTRVVVIGNVNDVELYRRLIRYGVSEYMVTPVETPALVDTITDLFASEGAEPIGRTIAFISAKGGAGSSTIAHNTAWSLSQQVRRDVLIMDMDLPFGTAGLNFNQEPPHGIADAVFSNDDVDDVVIERLMSKCANHINLLTAPANLNRDYDFHEQAFENIIEICQKNMPLVVLDLPHVWNGWVRHTLSTVDEVVVVAEPDLANLRNVKFMMDTLKSLRMSEAEPVLLMNKVGVPKRPELSTSEFANTIEVDIFAEVAFEAGLFGTAANNGQMIAEVNATHKMNETFNSLARRVSGRDASTHQEANGLLPGILKKLKLG